MATSSCFSMVRFTSGGGLWGCMSTMYGCGLVVTLAFLNGVMTWTGCLGVDCSALTLMLFCCSKSVVLDR